MKIGFIGAGNMGSALARAAAKGVPGAELLVADRDAEKARALAEALGGTVAENRAAAAACDCLFLGVKPQVMPEMLAELAPVLAGRRDRFFLVTMAAGLTLEKVGALAGGEYPMIRIMPNTPASIGQGMILYCRNELITDAEEAEFCRILSAAGELCPLPEKSIDAGSVVSGCGPAYFYMFMDAMARGGEACGLQRAEALRLAAVTARGAAAMVLETGEDPVKLRTDVCSPGGSTIEGVKVFQAGGLDELTERALAAAYRRTLELGQ